MPQLYGQWELFEKATWMRALLHSLSAVSSKDLCDAQPEDEAR